MNLMQAQLKGISPVTASNAYHETSKRYGFQSSQKIVDYFQNAGFNLDGVSYGTTRKAGKEGYQKHIMVFSRPDLIIDGNNKLQILALNSHDASSALKLNLGVYRAVCANGLVAGDDLYTQKIRHFGSMEKKVKESLEYLLSHMLELKNEVKAMKAIQLNNDQRQALLREAIECRFNEKDNIYSIDSRIDRVRRVADAGQDLWRTFNRIQETMIKGGLKYTKKIETKDKEGNFAGNVFKRNITRPISAPKKVIDVNKKLWASAIKIVGA